MVTLHLAENTGVQRVLYAQRNSTSFDLPVPAHMCLPIDELQRKAEELEYSELLDQVPPQASFLPSKAVSPMFLVCYQGLPMLQKQT